VSVIDETAHAPNTQLVERPAREGGRRGLLTADVAIVAAAALVGAAIRLRFAGLPYTADEGGYSNGIWRAEGNAMAHIETFTPLSSETAGPPVHRQPRP